MTGVIIKGYYYLLLFSGSYFGVDLVHLSPLLPFLLFGIVVLEDY